MALLVQGTGAYKGNTVSGGWLMTSKGLYSYEECRKQEEEEVLRWLSQ